MKVIALLALLIFVSCFGFGTRAYSAPTPKFKVQIVPLECQFTVIDTGTNEIEYLTPAACGQAVPPTNSGGQPSSGTTIPGIPLTFDIPSDLGFAPLVDEQDPEPETDINLSDFTDYLEGIGHRLALQPGQVVHFSVGGEEHSITVKEIGSDYVVLTIASTPFETILYIGNTNQYDVSGDSTYDIEISLLGIKDKVANLAFRQLNPLERQTTPTGAAKHSSSRWPQAMEALAGSGVIGIVVLYRKGYLPKPRIRR